MNPLPRADREFVERTANYPITNIIARKSEPVPGIVVIGECIVRSGVSRVIVCQLISGLLVVDKLRPGIVQPVLETAGVALFDARVKRVIAGLSLIRGDDTHVSKLRKRAKRLRVFGGGKQGHFTW